jgi:hypothetical protein
MANGERTLRVIVAVLAVCAAACQPLGPPRPQPPLDPAAENAATEKLARAFAGVCLNQPDPTAATKALMAEGWPRFNTVWREPASVFYAAPPSPAGLFVIGDKRWGGVTGAQQITCVGHYPARTALPMMAAIARRWGPGRDGAGPYLGARIWTFSMKSGALTPVSMDRGISPAETALLAPDEARVFVQVSYNASLGDVASLIGVSRSAR